MKETKLLRLFGSGSPKRDIIKAPTNYRLAG